MSTNQSIYQQPLPAKPISVPRRPMVRQISATPNPAYQGIKNNVSPGFAKSRQISATPNPAFIGAPKPLPVARVKPVKSQAQKLTEEKLQTLEKIEEMKDAAETKSADEMSNKATKKYAIIGAIILVMIAVGTLLWVFVLSKTRSVKDAFSSSDDLVTSGKSSDKWADSSGKSADSSGKL